MSEASDGAGPETAEDAARKLIREAASWETLNLDLAELKQQVERLKRETERLEGRCA